MFCAENYANLQFVPQETDPNLETFAIVSGEGIGGTFTLVDNSFTVDGGVIVEDGAARRWRRIFDGPINPEWWGARSGIGPATMANAPTNNTAFQDAIDYAQQNNSVLAIPGGNYVITTELEVNTRSLTIKGDRVPSSLNPARNGTMLIFKNNTVGSSLFKVQGFVPGMPEPVVDARQNDFIEIRDLSIGTYLGVDADTGVADTPNFIEEQSGIRFEHGFYGNLKLSNLTFARLGGHCINFTQYTYAHLIQVNNIKAWNVYGVIKSSLNSNVPPAVTPSNPKTIGLGVNATNVNINNIQVDMIFNETTHWGRERVLFDLSYFRMLNMHSIIVQGANANPQLVVLRTNLCRAMSFEDFWSELALERVTSAPGEPVVTVPLVAPLAYFQIGDPNATSNDRGVVDIKDFNIEPDFEFPVIHVVSPALVKIENIVGQFKSPDNFLLISNPEARVLIDGVSTTSPLFSDYSNTPQLDIRNVNHYMPGNLTTLNYNMYDNLELFNYAGEGRMRDLNNRFFDLNKFGDLYTDCQFVLDADEGRVTEYTQKGNQYPRFFLAPKVDTDSILPAELLGQMIIVIRYKVIDTDNDTTLSRVLFAVNGVVPQNKTRLYNVDKTNEWATGIMIVNGYDENIRIESFGTLAGNSSTPIKIRIAALKVLVGKDVPYVLNEYNGKTPVTVHADAIPTTGDWIVGDRIYYKEPVEGGPVGACMVKATGGGTPVWKEFGETI